MTWLHLYARFLCAATILLITAGGMVTSTGSGLAVPDWPNTYGQFMFAFPLSKMVGGIGYEHGHRMIASVVGMLTIGLAVWLWRVEPRRWMRRLGLVALAAVILQGLLGGITVLYFLPTPVSVSHAGLAEIFFCLTVCLALFTSVGWRESGAADTHLPVVHDQTLHRRGETEEARHQTLLALATGLPVLVFVQILIGATMRHTGAGLAIPDFPLAFGRLVPPVWSFAIGVHFLHRLGAVVTTLVILATFGHLLAHHRSRRDLVGPGGLLVLLVLIQVGLGGWTVLSGRAPVINTAHVATGAMVLGTALVIGLRTNRHRFSDAGRVASPPIGSTDLELAAPGASV